MESFGFKCEDLNREITAVTQQVGKTEFGVNSELLWSKSDIFGLLCGGGKSVEKGVRLHCGFPTLTLGSWVSSMV